jgi:hypothetical protein
VTAMGLEQLKQQRRRQTKIATREWGIKQS